MPEELTKEYLLLFNAITTAIDKLEIVRMKLMIAQQEAEAIYLERTE